MSGMQKLKETGQFYRGSPEDILIEKALRALKQYHINGGNVGLYYQLSRREIDSIKHLLTATPEQLAAITKPEVTSSGRTTRPPAPYRTDFTPGSGAASRKGMDGTDMDYYGGPY